MSKPLTLPQRYLLEATMQNTDNCGLIQYDADAGPAFYAPTRRLLKRALIEMLPPRRPNTVCWRITEAGRSALKEDRS